MDEPIISGGENTVPDYFQSNTETKITTENASDGRETEADSNKEPASSFSPEQIAELQKKAQQLDAFAPVVEQLRGQGLNDAQAVQAYLAQQQVQSAFQVQADQIFDALQQQIDAGDLTVEQAESLYKERTENLQARFLLQQLTQTQQENALIGAIEAFPQVKALGDTGRDTVRRLMATGLNAGDAVKALDGILTVQAQRAVTEYAKTAGKAGQSPTPQGSGQSPSPHAGQQLTKDMSFSELFGVRRN